MDLELQALLTSKCKIIVILCRNLVDFHVNICMYILYFMNVMSATQHNIIEIFKFVQPVFISQRIVVLLCSIINLYPFAQ